MIEFTLALGIVNLAMICGLMFAVATHIRRVGKNLRVLNAMMKATHEELRDLDFETRAQWRAPTCVP